MFLLIPFTLTFTPLSPISNENFLLPSPPKKWIAKQAVHGFMNYIFQTETTRNQCSGGYSLYNIYKFWENEVYSYYPYDKFEFNHLLKSRF